MVEFGVAEADALLADIFAPWVQEMELKTKAIDAKGADLVLPANPRLVHYGGVICGQAIAAAADTAATVALAAQNGRFRRCTTVDLTTHFIRPLAAADVELRADVLSNGRRLAYLRVEMRSAGDARLAVSATLAFAYLED